MAKPRVFISSTYYDLRHVRTGLEKFVESLGYEPVLFEKGHIPFHPDQALEESCYAEIRNCHMLVLIIGGRYGSLSKDTQRISEDELEKIHAIYKSITRKEYETAREKDIPIFIFVEKDVMVEYRTYQQNKSNKTIKYAHVETDEVFKLLEDILNQDRNNFVKEFSHIDEVASWLRDQWAGLFTEFLTRRTDQKSITALSNQVADLKVVTNGLKEYTETILKKVAADAAPQIISDQDRKLKERNFTLFSRHPMIRHFHKGTKVLNRMPTSADLDKFLKAKKIGDYLKSIGYTGQQIAEQMEIHGRAARDDFRELKNRLSGLESEMEIEDKA